MANGFGCGHMHPLHQCLCIFVSLFHVSIADHGIFTVTLEKEHVPIKRNNQVIAHKTAYFGAIYVGWPQQKFTMVFDTGSGHMVVPSMSCRTETCGIHSRYNRTASKSGIDIDYLGAATMPGAERDEVTVAFGTGDIQGPFVRETVCLQAFAEPFPAVEKLGDLEVVNDTIACVRARLITAWYMSDEPFVQFAFDGVAGLGLQSLALNPEFSFFGQMIALNSALLAPRFGVFLSQSDGVPSEISFGGTDERRIRSEVKWVPVVSPDLGHWQVSVKSVRIGDKILPICEDGTCVAILDTGTSLLGVPKSAAESMNWLLARVIPDPPSELDCRRWPGPDLVFDLGIDLQLVIGADDYSRPAATEVKTSKKSSNVFCRASLLPIEIGPPLGNKVFIFGEPILRKYYTTYDYSVPSAGFALAAQHDSSSELPGQSVFTTHPKPVQVPNILHV